MFCVAKAKEKKAMFGVIPSLRPCYLCSMFLSSAEKNTHSDLDNLRKYAGNKIFVSHFL